MKLAIGFVALLSVSTAFASATKGAIQPGEYSSKHEIGLMYIDNEKACKEEDGQWNGDICIVEGSDNVSIQPKAASDRVLVEVSTVGTNIHMCEFQGEGKVRKNGTIVATSEKIEIETDDGKVKTTACVLVISKDANGVNVAIGKGKDAACSTMCGANVSLEIEGAK